MERLTHYDESGRPYSSRGYEITLERLATYEDTGYDPEKMKPLAQRLIAKAPVFKTGETFAFVDYADGHGETQVNKWADWCCPQCGWFVGEQYVPRRHNQQKCEFCSRCGQAIDWTAVEKKDGE